MPLPKLEEICLRKPRPKDRTLALTRVSPDGRSKIFHEWTSTKDRSAPYHVFLNGRLVDVINCYAIISGIWSTDSRLYSYLIAKNDTWHLFTYSALAGKCVYRKKLGDILDTLDSGGLDATLLRMTPDGLVHGYAGQYPSYFTFHAWKNSPIGSTPIKFAARFAPQAITQSVDGTFAAYRAGELFLSRDGHHWNQVARHDERESSPYNLQFTNSGKSLTMEILGRTGWEIWTLPLDRLSPQRPATPTHPATRPIIL